MSSYGEHRCTNGPVWAVLTPRGVSLSGMSYLDKPGAESAALRPDTCSRDGPMEHIGRSEMLFIMGCFCWVSISGLVRECIDSSICAPQLIGLRRGKAPTAAHRSCISLHGPLHWPIS